MVDFCKLFLEYYLCSVHVVVCPKITKRCKFQRNVHDDGQPNHDDVTQSKIQARVWDQTYHLILWYNLRAHWPRWESIPMAGQNLHDWSVVEAVSISSKSFKEITVFVQFSGSLDTISLQSDSCRHVWYGQVHDQLVREKILSSY